jgi:hypothetical protein
MKVGHKPKTPKEPCPECGQEYLKQSYEKVYTPEKKQKWIVIGKHCPAENCNYCRKE